jgi:peptidoglycan/xylan/chitin deacetylase (PgdA/CDA1 family)
MPRSLPERDWKYLRSIEPELLSNLCRKINQKAAQLLNSEFESEHKKYLALYKHIKASDKIVADCFNDWRRSNLWLIVPLLRKHDVLKDEYIANLSDAARELLDRFERLAKG